MRFTIAPVTAVSIIAFMQIASAATPENRPVRRAPPPQPAPATTTNWTGFYSGPNAGGGFENTIKNSATTIPSLCDDPGMALCAALTAGVPGQFNTHPRGFIGGGQIGYNWQTGVFVWGVETDFQGANIQGDKSVANAQVVPIVNPFDSAPGLVITSGTGSQKIGWLGTVRARLGWTPTPPVLIYATGGLAYGQVKTDVSFAGQIAVSPGPPQPPFSGATAASNNQTRAGWTIGGGAEWMFAPQWSIKGEYLYYDLGTVTIDQTLNTCCDFGAVQSSTTIHSDAHYHGSIVRLGLNYQFIAATGLIGASAFAADLPVKAPPPPPILSWTGGYVGGNVGYSWGGAHTDLTGSGSGVQFCPAEQHCDAEPPNPFSTSFADSQTQQLTGVIGGGQIGYNHEINHQWVLGFEADIQGSDERGSTTLNDPFLATVCNSFLTFNGRCNGSTPLNGTSVTSLEAKIEWFGTARMRGGVLLNDGLLLYVTGGAAYGQVNVAGNVLVTASTPFVAPPFIFGPTTSAFDHSSTNLGWTLGGGLEGRFLGLLSPDWTWKVEYLYVDLGPVNDTVTPFSAASNTILAGPLNGTVRTNTHFTDNIVRVGVNYHWGAPVVANY